MSSVVLQSGQQPVKPCGKQCADRDGDQPRGEDVACHAPADFAETFGSADADDGGTDHVRGADRRAEEGCAKNDDA